ncbi:hypothetical protein DHEL01_v202904 [Diaporthe helianthi]|uniref:Uncharacterized protein n=1 Tax=Diaporthe helianthi TaxID=158607 RepID=A0A2P5I857_DIAHE|nr:hypothetical protein DHEL01_v202904 [Diaporthe helianthi]
MTRVAVQCSREQTDILIWSRATLDPDGALQTTGAARDWAGWLAPSSRSLRGGVQGIPGLVPSQAHRRGGYASLSRVKSLLPKLVVRPVRAFPSAPTSNPIQPARSTRASFLLLNIISSW